MLEPDEDSTYILLWAGDKFCSYAFAVQVIWMLIHICMSLMIKQCGISSTDSIYKSIEIIPMFLKLKQISRFCSVSLWHAGCCT